MLFSSIRQSGRDHSIDTANVPYAILLSRASIVLKKNYRCDPQRTPTAPTVTGLANVAPSPSGRR